MCVGPTDVILGRDVVLGESHCRIITASGSVVGVDGMLRFIWEDPTMEEVVANDFTLSLHLIDGAKDWLLSMPELSAGGFRAFLDRKLGKSFLVFPNGFAVLLAQEADDCWSLDVAVYQNIDGTLRFGLASGELFKMISEPVFEKVRDVDRKRPCNVDSVARDSDLSCFMDESQTDGAYFSWSGDRDDPCVSFLAGDASLRCSHDVNSWDSDPENSLDGDDYEWLVEDDSDGTPALKSMSDHFFENVDGVDPVWYNGGQRFDNDGDAELGSNGHHICDYVDPVSSSGGQQVYDEIGSIPDDRNRLHQCKVHSTMPSGVDVWAGPQNGSAPSDIFVGSLRKANAAVEFEDVSDSPGLCKVCKQDVMSFVGIVSCACDMSDGMASKGIPQWLYEEGKIDVENTVDFHFESSMVFDDSPGNEQFGIPVCGVCQVYEVENLASHMCRVCQSAVYGAESSESQFVHGDPHSYGHLPVGGVQLFCQRCATGIVSGDYCHNCAQLLGVPFLSDETCSDEKPQGIKVSMEYADGVDWNNPLEEKIKVYNNTDYDFEVDGSGERMVIDANGVREDIRYLRDDGDGVQSASSKGGGADDMFTTTKEQMNERFDPGVQRLADGSVPGRFPILRDPKAFHLAHGHPSDEVTRKLCEACFGNPTAVKGYADVCPYCLSRRRRRQPRGRAESVDRPAYVMGEMWSMDFTAMTLRESHDKNRVGVLFEESISEVLVGVALKDHTHITEALDFLWNYVRTEKRGVQLRVLYADCDPIWFSTNELKMFLRKVGRWCFMRSVVLFTNATGQSSQNGRIEGGMSRVMSLTSVQLQCSFLNELVWDRSFLHAIFIISRRYMQSPRSPHVKGSWHRMPHVVWSGRFTDLTILICAFGQALVLKNDKKNNSYERQGELALWMGIPWQSKGWLVWNVPRQRYQIRYNVKVIKNMMLRPAQLCVRNELQLAGPMVPADGGDLMGQNVIGLLQAYDPERNQADWNDYVIGFSSSDGQPMLVESFMNLDSNELDSYLVPEEVMPEAESKDDSDERKDEDLFVGSQPDGEEGKVEGQLQEHKDDGIPDHECQANFFSGEPPMKLFDMDDGVSLEDPRTGLNQTGVQKRLELNGAQKRWFEWFWKDGSNKIKFQVANPKAKNSQTWHRYEKYKKSKTIADMQLSGGTKADLIYAFCRGQVVLGKHTSVDVVRGNPLLKAMLVSSPAKEAVRAISEVMETGTVMDEVLGAKVNRVSSTGSEPSKGVIDPKSVGGEASAEEGCPLYKELIEKLGVEMGDLKDANTELKLNLKKLVNDIKIAKEGKVGRSVKFAEEGRKDKHLPKKAREDKKAAEAREANIAAEVGEVQDEVVEDDNLTWEEKDIMRGLGISGLHHVSSSIPVAEMVSRVSAKVCQVLVDIENHLRDKEGRPFKSQIDELSRAAMNAVLDPRNDDAFKHSEAFKDLFHVYATKVIKIKDVMKNFDTNGWKDPVVAEWKRILVDFPCLEALDSLPPGAKVVTLMWVLNQKQAADGTDTRKKARLVACQTLDKYWYEKDSKISPTVNPDAVKIMCSMCLQLDMSMETRDQAGGYLHAVYPEDADPVYVRIPDYLNEILVDSPELVPVSPNGRPAKYFRVRRALYGCQLSCKLFYRMFRDFMIGSETKPDKDGLYGAGWTMSEIDPCVFFKKEGKGFAVLCCHVDDSLMIATKDDDGQRIRREFSDAYASRFAVSPECTDGDEHEYLSMLLKIDRKAGTMTFRMPKLFKKLKALLESMGSRARRKAKFARREKRVIDKVYSEFPKEGKDGVNDCGVRTPMALDNSSIYEPSMPGNSIVPYDVFDSRRILGLAAYIILGIRPDAAHAAAIVARFTGSKQTEAVIDHCVRLAWYLVDTEESCVLTYRRSPDGLDLTGMVDASFANDPLTKRSYFGYVLRFGANPIAWKSKLETSVALSTRDSELMAAVHAVRHILGIRFFLKELGLLKTGASTIMTDNRASMDGVQNDKNHKGSHYMGYRLSWLREQVADLLVKFVHVGSTQNHADIFTKVLQEDVFKGLQAELLNLSEVVL